MASVNFPCNCTVTRQDICKKVSNILGYRVGYQVVARTCNLLAQVWCDREWEKGGNCQNNPFIPKRKIGNTFVYDVRTARKIVAAVALNASRDHAARAAKRYGHKQPVVRG